MAVDDQESEVSVISLYSDAIRSFTHFHGKKCTYGVNVAVSGPIGWVERNRKAEGSIPNTREVRPLPSPLNTASFAFGFHTGSIKSCAHFLKLLAKCCELQRKISSSRFL